MTATTAWLSGYGNVGALENTASTTYYNCLAGNAFPGTLLAGIETTGQYYSGVAGTGSNLSLTVTSFTRSTATVWTFRKNAGNGNQTVSISGTGTTTDATHTDTIAATDLVCYSKVNGTGAGGIQHGTCMQFAPSSGTAISLVSSATGIAMATGTTRYLGIAGDFGGGTNTTEANAQIYAQTPGTLQDFYSNCGANTASIAQSINLRVGGANGNQSVSITGGSADAQFVDTTHTDTITAGNLLNIQAPSRGGSGSVTVVSVGGTFVCSTDGHFWTGNCQAAAAAITASGFLAACYGGYSSGALASEATVQYETIAATTKGLWQYIAGNTSSANITLAFRKGGASVNQSVSITANTANTAFQDSTHSDTIVATDTVDIGYSGFSSGGITLCGMSMEWDVATSGGATPLRFNSNMNGLSAAGPFFADRLAA